MEIALLESLDLLESLEIEGLVYGFIGHHVAVASCTRPRNQMADLAQVPHGQHGEMV